MKRPTGQAHWTAVPPRSHCVRSASPEENAARIVQAMRLPSLADGDFSADDELLARHAELLLNIERLRIAKPALEAEAQRRNRLVGQAANPAQNIEDAIDKRRRELKLAEARCRCGF